MHFSTVNTDWDLKFIFTSVLSYANVLPGAAFQCLGLIQDHVLPFDPLEVLDVLDHQLVACDNHVEGCILRVKGFLHKYAQMEGETEVWEEEYEWAKLPQSKHIIIYLQNIISSSPGSRISESPCDREGFPSRAAPGGNISNVKNKKEKVGSLCQKDSALPKSLLV